jgi:Holliday junction resolvase
MSARERNKGARGELEVLELVRARWPRATRNFASGAAGNGDIAHGPAAVLLECKRTERFRVRDAWTQASRDAEHAGAGVMPVVATRWNGGPWLAVVELDELLALVELRERS